MREALQIAANAGIAPHIETRPLESINDVFNELEVGAIQGRIVLDFAPVPNSLTLKEIPEPALSKD